MKNRKEKIVTILKLIINAITCFLGKHNKSLILSLLSEKLVPVIDVSIDNNQVHLYCPSSLPIMRAYTLFSKEPETIDWINGFTDGSVFWDIGANVGMYSIYAAKKRAVTVYAFEPAAVNYHILTKNIELNNLDDSILAYCIAFNDTTRLDTFYMSNTEQGSALHSFGEKIDFQGKSFVPKFNQAMIGYSINDFIKHFDIEIPNYIKIDVDGLEGKIIFGAGTLLSNKQLKSILIELDLKRHEYCDRIVREIRTHGFRLLNEYNQNEIPLSTVNLIFYRN